MEFGYLSGIYKYYSSNIQVAEVYGQWCYRNVELSGKLSKWRPITPKIWHKCTPQTAQGLLKKFYRFIEKDRKANPKAETTYAI